MSKTNKLKFILGCILLITMTIGLCSCGKSSKKDASGMQKKWGNISVYVPDSMFMTGGTLIDASDENSLWLKDKESPEYYISIVSTDEETAKNDVEFTKTLEESEDVQFELDKITWSGIKYQNGYNECFIIYGQNGKNTYEVSGYGYSTTDKTVEKILSSIKAV